MATTNFQWIIAALNCAVESEGLSNVINVIHWRYNATQVDGDDKKILHIKEDIGVIAQEVAELLPELARTNEDGFMSVRYQGLTAVLIEAIKEQQIQIESQKSQNEELSNRILTLESILQNKGI